MIPRRLLGRKNTKKSTNSEFIFTVNILENDLEFGIFWIKNGQTTNATVNWGDGATNNITAWDDLNLYHTYSAAGTYDISIKGTCAALDFNSEGRLVDIKQWGYLDGATDWSYAFFNCYELTCSATDAFGKNVVNMEYMFRNCQNFNGAVGNWDTSSVTNMRSMFNYASSFNQPLDSWDTSKVTIMSDMFNGALVFNQPLNNWNVTNVTNMSGMFNLAKAFDQSLDKWNVSKVTNMSQMFANTETFNQPLNTWNVSEVTNMMSMFNYATAFNKPLYNWNVSKVSGFNMMYMFNGAAAFNQNLSCWDVQHIASLPAGFADACPINGTAKMPKWGQLPNTGCTEVLGYDPMWTSVELLAEFDGTSIIDTSSKVRTISLSGTPTLVTTPVHVGTNSCYFNGTDSYLTVTMPGMQNYTFEWWMYPSVNTAGVWIRANNGADYCNAGFGSGGYLVAFKDVTTTIANSAIPLNTWTHIAIQRQGTVGTIFINGVQQYQNNSVNTIYGECPMQFFGAHDLTDFKGNIDSLRVTYVARYSGNFIPNYIPHPIS